MTRVAAERGLEGATIAAAVQAAGLSRGAFYRLYESREACVLEAFERCASTLLARVAEAAERRSGDSRDGLEAGLGELRELLGAYRDVARLLLVEIRAGGLHCREAQQRWLGRFARLSACGGESGHAPERGGVAWLVTAALSTMLALDLENDDRGTGASLEELATVAMWPRHGAALEVPVETDGPSEAGTDKWVEAERERRGAARRRCARRIERERILAAMTESVGSMGYKATQLGDVLERAEVSPFVFYTQPQAGGAQGAADALVEGRDRCVGALGGGEGEAVGEADLASPVTGGVAGPRRRRVGAAECRARRSR